MKLLAFIFEQPAYVPMFYCKKGDTHISFFSARFKHNELTVMHTTRGERRGDRGWLMHAFLVFLGYLVIRMTKYDHFCMC